MKIISESEKIGQAVLGELSGDPDLLVAILFGSAATNRMHAESDVDIAVLYAQPLGADKKMTLINQLGICLERQVDLVDLSSVTGVILGQVLCKGTVLLKRDTATYAGLLERLVYNREDMMPYYRRAVQQRVKRFAHG